MCSCGASCSGTLLGSLTCSALRGVYGDSREEEEEIEIAESEKEGKAE